MVPAAPTGHPRSQAVADDAAATMQCMEIFGGNEAVDTAMSVPGIDAWFVSVPHGSANAGGDIHYASLCGGGNIARFLVADVSGHGDKVSELSGKLRGQMRRHINKVNQARFARVLNKAFSKLADDGNFATAIMATYYAPTDHLIVCNAGHPPPLWYRAGRGDWQWLQHDVPDRVDRLSNLPLGVIDPTDYHQFAVPLAKDDLILLYTDAAIEASTPGSALLGPAGFLKLVSGLDAGKPGAMCGRLIDSLSQLRGGSPQEDDITFVLLRHNAVAPRMPSVYQTMKVMGKMLRLIPV